MATQTPSSTQIIDDFNKFGISSPLELLNKIPSKTKIPEIEKSTKQNNVIVFRIIRFLVFLFICLGLWLGQTYGTVKKYKFFNKIIKPTVSVLCLNDPIHNYLEFWNNYTLTNESGARFLQISSSLLMDLATFTLLIYWFLYIKSSRPIITTIFFYSTRAVCQILIQMKFPDGHNWDYPGFPSYVVPYGKTRHCGFLNIVSLEWLTLGKTYFFSVVVATNIYMAFVMLIFRAHYAIGNIYFLIFFNFYIDITTGLIVSHYCYIIVKKNQEAIDSFFIFLYSKIFCFSKKIQTKMNDSADIL